MYQFQWTPSHDVFLPALDDEHRTIFQIASELQVALWSRAPRFQLQEILHRLMAHVESHFSREEKLMTETNYLSMEWHQRQHDTLRERMQTLAPLIEEGDVEAGKELLEFIGRWFDEHTSLTDRMLGAHLRNQERARRR